MKVRLSVVTISKTDKFENAGVPIYAVDSNIDIKVDLPDHIRKLLEERQKVEKACLNKI